jgi:hypothetical protein
MMLNDPAIRSFQIESKKIDDRSINHKIPANCQMLDNNLLPGKFNYQPAFNTNHFSNNSDDQSLSNTRKMPYNYQTASNINLFKNNSADQNSFNIRKMPYNYQTTSNTSQFSDDRSVQKAFKIFQKPDYY